LTSRSGAAATARACDLFLDEHDEHSADGPPCGDKAHQVALANRRAGAAPWFEIERGRDGGGDRDFLDGKPIHCGSGLELQILDHRSDDYGEYSVRLGSGVDVRYELSWEADRDGKRRIDLYTTLGGYEFAIAFDSFMRFRRPVRR
jgi:hypothetical protein